MSGKPGEGNPKKPKLDPNEAHKQNPGSMRDAADNGKPEPDSARWKANGHHDDNEPPPWGSPGHAPNLASRTLKTAELGGITMRHIDWLWQQRIARSKLTIIAGDPNQGKTMVMLDLCARISRGGKWPGEDDTSPEIKGRVVIISAEDSADDTLKPRFLAAGGDCNQVCIVQAVRETNELGKNVPTAFSLQRDLDALDTTDVALLALDPLNAFLGEGVNSHEAAAVRGVLTMLDEFARSRNVAVLGIMHPPKAVADNRAMNAISGSIAFVAAARMVLLCSTDQEDETSERHLFTAAKNNLGRRPNALAYKIDERIVTADGISTTAPCVQWEFRSFRMTADEAMAQEKRKELTPKLREAVAFIIEQLEDGPKLQNEIEVAAKDAGIAATTLQRAKTLAKAVSKKTSEGWFWQISK